MTTGEAAALLPVDEETLRRWVDLAPGKHFAKAEVLRLPSGHRRIRRSAVDRILRGDPPTPEGSGG